MDWAFFSGIIALASTGLLCLFCVGAFLSRPRLDVGSGDDAVLFRHSIIFRIFAVVVTMGMMIFLTIMIFVSPPREDEIWIVFACCGFFALLGVPLVWESMRFGLIVSAHGLDCHSPWRRGRFLTWDEIDEVIFKPTGSAFAIRALDDWRFRVSIIVPRLRRFLEICEAHLPVSALESARPGYERLRRPFPGGPVPVEAFDLSKWIEQRRHRRK
jgi:hypothetical protein